MGSDDHGSHDRQNEESTLDCVPPAFKPDGMTWFDDPDGQPLRGYFELVLAAKVAYYGNLGLFVHRAKRDGMFEWYEDSEAGWDNRNRDLAWISPKSNISLAISPRRRIMSIEDLIAFCRFAISGLLDPITEFDSNASSDPDFWLSDIDGKREGGYCKICRPYNAALLLTDVYRVCTCLLPANKVPSRPAGRTAQDLNNFLDRVHVECLKTQTPSTWTRTKPNDKAPGRLGLIVDYENRTVQRAGYHHRVDLRNSPALWETFCVFFKAGDNDASEEAWKQSLTGEQNSTRMHRKSLKESLQPLGITIPFGGRRLIDEATP